MWKSSGFTILVGILGFNKHTGFNKAAAEEHKPRSALDCVSRDSSSITNGPRTLRADMPRGENQAVNGQVSQIRRSWPQNTHRSRTPSSGRSWNHRRSRHSSGTDHPAAPTCHTHNIRTHYFMSSTHTQRLTSAAAGCSDTHTHTHTHTFDLRCCWL